jgi:alpha-glucoside transport system ATP-binding protein
MVAKLPGTHADLRGKIVKLTADPARVQVFHNGLSLRTR